MCGLSLLIENLQEFQKSYFYNIIKSLLKGSLCVFVIFSITKYSSYKLCGQICNTELEWDRVLKDIFLKEFFRHL